MKRTALVTGGNRGIGLAIAAGLANEGLRVLIGSRDAASGEVVAKQLHGDVTAVELDLSSRKRLSGHLRRIQDQHEPVDVLVNNAGILEQGNLLEVSPEAFANSMRVNFEAPFETIKSVVPGMIQRGYGRVVNISSGWGSFADGLTGPAAYSVSKAALNALTLTLHQAVRHQDVKVNAMCPGWVRTAMGGQAADRSPEEGADTAVWLATLPHDGPTGGFFRDRRTIAW